MIFFSIIGTFSGPSHHDNQGLDVFWFVSVCGAAKKIQSSSDGWGPMPGQDFVRAQAWYFEKGSGSIQALAWFF